jgi:hypothetical protein
MALQAAAHTVGCWLGQHDVAAVCPTALQPVQWVWVILSAAAGALCAHFMAIFRPHFS